VHLVEEVRVVLQPAVSSNRHHPRHQQNYVDLVVVEIGIVRLLKPVVHPGEKNGVGQDH
jgi:hypothetical protein